MAKRVPKMIEEQIQFWRLKHQENRVGQKLEPSISVITISREYGAGGALISGLLEKRLGFKVWDKEVLKVISEDLGKDMEFMESLDEHTLDTIEDTIFGLMNQKGTNLNYLIYLVKAINTIEKYGKAIIVGRGANYICDPAKTFNVRVVAPLKNRIQLISEKENLSFNDAKKLVTSKDEERAQFVRHNFNREINNAADYDLVINSETFDHETAADLIVNTFLSAANLKRTPVKS